MGRLSAQTISLCVPFGTFFVFCASVTPTFWSSVQNFKESNVMTDFLFVIINFFCLRGDPLGSAQFVDPPPCIGQFAITMVARGGGQRATLGPAWSGAIRGAGPGGGCDGRCVLRASTVAQGWRPCCVAHVWRSGSLPSCTVCSCPVDAVWRMGLPGSEVLRGGLLFPLLH